MAATSTRARCAFRRWGLDVLFALALAAVATGAEKPEGTVRPTTRPRPMAEIAQEIARIEGEVDRIEAEIEKLRTKRPGEIRAEISKLLRTISESKRALAASKSRGVGKLTVEQQREYRQLLKDHKKKLQDLKKERDNKLKKYTGKKSGKAYRKFKKNTERDYDRARKGAIEDLKDRVRDLRKGDGAEDFKQKIKDAEESMKTLRAERLDLNKKISALRKDLAKQQVPLRKLYAEAVRRRVEAWNVGLRPRGGSYSIDPETDKLVVAGGYWGKPVDNKKWHRGNEAHARRLLALAETAKQGGKAELARVCLQRILDEYAATKAAPLAAKALGVEPKKPEKPADSPDDGGDGDS